MGITIDKTNENATPHLIFEEKSRTCARFSGGLCASSQYFSKLGRAIQRIAPRHFSGGQYTRIALIVAAPLNSSVCFPVGRF